MNLTPVTDDVFQLALMPRAGINAYLVGDVLVDAGLGLHGRGILKAVTGHTVVTHVLTHAHGDHVGGSKKVSDALGVPVWCGAGDAGAVRAGNSSG
jgi:glyoxylase-like metal-dependent hydrolase (beta-lactamase superfamily II)